MVRNRALINEYLSGYLHHANYMSPYFPHTQQWSTYEGCNINAAYSRNINMRGQKAIMERYMFDQGLITEEMSARTLESVIEPARRFKLAISTRQINTDLIGQPPDVSGEALQVLLPILTSYPASYRF
ncbi:hypothetical protein BX666DRAFT_2022760 [Dichotomocladium elegans]|nr:hypothetical protein BX666DRAFT_2022760 [Dichotomocladium elegans]